MNLSVVFTVLPLVFLGELPDKTMFASLVMASRGRPLATWLGTIAGFAVHVVIAVSIGVAVFKLLPHQAVDLIVAAMFLLGAALAWRSRNDEEEETDIEARPSAVRTAATAAGVIFLAEWGDLTQILTADFAARYHDPLSVGVGALVALAAVSGLASVAGQGLLRVVPVRTLRIVTAVVLVGLAVWSATKAL